MNFQKINTLVVLSLALTCISTINTAANTADQKSKSILTKIRETLQYGPTSIRDVAQVSGIDSADYVRCHRAFLMLDKSGEIAARKLCFKEAEGKDRLEYILTRHGYSSSRKYVYKVYGEDDAKSVTDKPITIVYHGREFPSDVESEFKVLLALLKESK